MARSTANQLAIYERLYQDLARQLADIGYLAAGSLAQRDGGGRGCRPAAWSVTEAGLGSMCLGAGERAFYVSRADQDRLVRLNAWPHGACAAAQTAHRPEQVSVTLEN